MSGTIIRAVAYYRKSNDDRGELGESINQQKQWATEAAAREGVVIVREFADQSVSGWDTARRSEFANMLRFCQEQARLGNPVEAVVCYAANRFSRSDSLETARFLCEFRDAGVSRMLTAGKWVDFGRTEDRMIFGLEQEASAHRFSVDLSRVSRRGKRATAARGLWCGGKPPYGYAVETRPRLKGERKPPGGKLVVNPDEADVVKYMFAEYLRDPSGRGLARKLKERGVKSPTGRDAWCSQSVYRVLENPTYTGEIVMGRRTASPFLGTVVVRGKAKERPQPPEEWVRVPDAHEAIIDRETFDRVQAALVASQRDTSPAKGKPFVLTGLVRCGHCGGPMIGRTLGGASKNKKAYPHRYVTCNAYNTYGKASGCNLNAVKESDLLRVVVAKLTAALTDPATVERVRADIRAREAAKADDPTARHTDARLAELERKIRLGTERFLTAPDDLIEACREQLTQWKAERDRLTGEAAAAKAKAVSVASLESRVDAAVAKMSRLQDVFAKGNPAAVRALLREVIDRIELFFNHDTAKKRVYTTFAKGLIYVHPDCLITPDLSSDQSRGSPTATPRCTPNFPHRSIEGWWSRPPSSTTSGG